MFMSIWLEDWRILLFYLHFTLRWFFTGISWFSEDHENLISRKLSVSLFWVHYFISFPTAHRHVSVYQGRVSIHKGKEKAGIKGVVSSKGLFCSSVRLWNVGVDVLCTKGQFIWSPFITSCVSLRPGNRRSEYCSFTWPKLPFFFSCAMSQKIDLNSEYKSKG